MHTQTLPAVPAQKRELGPAAQKRREEQERETRELVSELQKKAEALHRTQPNMSLRTLLRLLWSGSQTGRKTPL